MCTMFFGAYLLHFLRRELLLRVADRSQERMHQTVKKQQQRRQRLNCIKQWRRDSEDNWMQLARYVCVCVFIAFHWCVKLRYFHCLMIWSKRRTDFEGLKNWRIASKSPMPFCPDLSNIFLYWSLQEQWEAERSKAVQVDPSLCTS